MKIIVTGAGGFVGRHLVRLLLERGDEVVAMDTAAGGIPQGATAIIGDISDAAVQASAFQGGCDALVHLATVPGGAAEADPAASRRVNIDAMYDLLERASLAGETPRVVYASSIAVLGGALPAAGVDDLTPVSPELVYGGHKAMMEVAVAMLSNRKAIDGVTIRLPGILARPKGPSGMKSAFMSDMFHALQAGEAFTCPTRPGATIWAQSVERCARNFIHAIDCDSSRMPPTRAVTLPALRVGMGDLALEISRQCGTPASLVTWQPDAALEAAFGAYPPLSAAAAEQVGFANDGSIASLVRSALKTLA